MNPNELELYLQTQADGFAGQCAYLVASPQQGEPLHLRQGDTVFPAASLIKTPILLTALEQVRQGMLALGDTVVVPPSAVLPDTQVFERGESRYTLEELLYWMIAKSDNTAANVVLDLLGLDAVNEYCSMTLGLQDTLCQRKMLDTEAARAGLDNLTSARDQRRLFCLLQGGSILNPSLRRTALSILTRQRDQSCLLRYIPDQLFFAHKTGSLPGVAHDCGLFLSLGQSLFVGAFTWGGPENDREQKKLMGRMGKAIFDTYKDL
jgi:beta-lactamase class A